MPTPTPTRREAPSEGHGMKYLLAYGLVVLLSGLVTPGSAGPLTDDEAARRPRIRIASLPFPNILFRRLNRTDLGPHHYRPRWKVWSDGEHEVSRGHFYTHRAGFVDLGHLRKTIDWAAYIQWHVHRAILETRESLVLKCSEPTLYRLSFSYPESWPLLPPEQREAHALELSILTGQQVAYTALTWHEILTWYGFKSTKVLPEKESAFSLEDMPTHALGIRIAGQALRDAGRPFNQAVEQAMRETMRELGIVDGSRTQEALDRTKGRWWVFGRGLKRYPYVGHESGYLVPWLVEGLPYSGAVEPARLHLPGFGPLDGIDYAGFLTVEIDPQVWAARKFRPLLSGGSSYVRPDQDFRVLVQAIHERMKAQFGPEVGLPYPVVP